VKLRRVRPAEALAGLGGATLLVALFLPWSATEPRCLQPPCEALTADGWESLRFIDVILAATAALGLSLPVLSATNEKPDAPIAATAIACLAAVVGGLLVLFRLIDPVGDERRGGLYLALAAVSLLAASAWWAMSAES
jgi:uncharacterized membrane protein